MLQHRPRAPLRPWLRSLTVALAASFVLPAVALAIGDEDVRELPVQRNSHGEKGAGAGFSTANSNCPGASCDTVWVGHSNSGPGGAFLGVGVGGNWDFDTGVAGTDSTQGWRRGLHRFHFSATRAVNTRPEWYLDYGNIVNEGNTNLWAARDLAGRKYVKTGVAGVFDVYPAPETRAGTVSQSSAAAAKHGQLSGSVFVPSAAATIRCHPAHSLKLISTQFSSVQLSQPDAGAQAIPGTFSQTYLTLPTESAPPTITDLTVGSTTLTIGGQSEPVTVTIHNPGGTVTSVVTQLWIRQGSTFKAAGGGGNYCGSVLDVPPGDCTYSLTVAANNASAGPGTLVPGPATFEVYLEKDNVRKVLDGRVVNVTLQ